MTDRRDPGAGDTEARDHAEGRLRRALASRAERVEPRRSDLADVEARVDALRRANRVRRTVLSVAAAVVVLVGVAGIVAIAGGGDADSELATDGSSGSTTSTPTSPDDPATVGPPDGALPPTPIWPLLAMSIVYDEPLDAALAFADAYLGLDEAHACPRTPEVDGPTASVGIVRGGVCGGVTSGADPFGPTTTVSLVQTGTTWAVTGATSNRFTVSFGPAEMDHEPAPGTPVPLSAFVTPTTDLDGPVSLELRRPENGEVVGFGSMPSGSEGERVQIPIGAPFDGTRVLVVTDGVTGVATLVHEGVSD